MFVQTVNLTCPWAISQLSINLCGLLYFTVAEFLLLCEQSVIVQKMYILFIFVSHPVSVSVLSTWQSFFLDMVLKNSYYGGAELALAHQWLFLIEFCRTRVSICILRLEKTMTFIGRSGLYICISDILWRYYFLTRAADILWERYHVHILDVVMVQATSILLKEFDVVACISFWMIL